MALTAATNFDVENSEQRIDGGPRVGMLRGQMSGE